jgi:hypothetical protein
MFLGSSEAVAKVLAYPCEVFIPLQMVKLETLIKFSVAHRTEVARVHISLRLVVGALHETLVPGAVAHSKHMAELMSCDLDHALQDHTLLHRLGGEFIPSHV